MTNAVYSARGYCHYYFIIYDKQHTIYCRRTESLIAVGLLKIRRAKKRKIFGLAASSLNFEIARPLPVGFVHNDCRGN
jgi:hypothetical protein